jgi:hypothetical protein
MNLKTKNFNYTLKKLRAKNDIIINSCFKSATPDDPNEEQHLIKTFLTFFELVLRQRREFLQGE